MIRGSRAFRVGFAGLLLGALVSAAGAAAQTPDAAQVQPQGNRRLCERCHDDLVDVLKGSQVHQPVAENDCTDCHNPHAARHGNLLREAGEELCLSCHAATREQLSQGTRHGALRDERSCLSCHAAHASDHGGLLRDGEAAVCAECHAPVLERSTMATGHAPAASGECTTCHTPHAGKSRLLETAVPGLCLDCHTGGEELDRAHEGFAVTDSDCLSCHDPHGAKSANLVRDAVHAVFEPGACDTCHAAPARPQELQADTAELCTTCHDPSDPGHSHPIGEDVSCTSCHSPHAGEEPAMLRGPERSLCLDCHGEIREAIDRGHSFHPLEAGEGRCTACHGLHDSADAPLLARPVGDLCQTCHQDHSRFAHPMGSNVPDPVRPGKSLECVSCHTPHASRHKMLLLASPDRDLCVRCHQNLH